MADKKVARIFQDVGGWFICDDASPHLDTRGMAFRTQRLAINHLRWCSMSNPTYRVGIFTHYLQPSGKARRVT